MGTRQATGVDIAAHVCRGTDSTEGSREVFSRSMASTKPTLSLAGEVAEASLGPAPVGVGAGACEFEPVHMFMVQSINIGLRTKLIISASDTSIRIHVDVNVQILY